MCKLEIFQCMHSGTGAPHKSHRLAASSKRKRGFGAHANHTGICCRKLKFCSGAATEKLTAPTPVPPAHFSPSFIALYPSPLRCPTAQPPPSPLSNISLPAGKPTSNACVQAIEMGHFLIKYNINYCEHHYRYVRFD